jgi:hypothetical protein
VRNRNGLPFLAHGFTFVLVFVFCVNLVCFRSVPYAQCYQCLLIAHSEFSLRFSLTFIYVDWLLNVK